MMKKVLMIVMMLMLCSSGSAYATWLDYTGDNTGEYGGQSFDQISIWWVSGPKLAESAFVDISDTGWTSQTVVAGEQAFMSGPAFTGAGPFDSLDPAANLFFSFQFEGDAPAPYELLYMASLDGTPYTDYRYQIIYDGGSDWETSWQYNVITDEATWQALGGSAPLSTYIPEPMSILLLGTGMAGIFGYRRKFKK